MALEEDVLKLELSIVQHTCNPSTGRTEASYTRQKVITHRGHWYSTIANIKFLSELRRRLGR